MLLDHLKTLVRHSAIYGAADVFGTVVNFLLLPILTRHLTSADYGTLGILLLFGVGTKIVFRMGLDSGFFRIYYDQTNRRDRRIFATTITATAAVVATSLFALTVAAAEPLSNLLLGGGGGKLIVLVATDTLLNTFAFVPMSLFRIEGRASYFTGATIFRNVLNAGLKVYFVMTGWGVEGVLWSDVVSTSLFVLALAPVLASNLGLGYSWPMLRDAAGFGLPKVPHGLAYQALNLADRKLLDVYTNRAEAGLYHVGYMFGAGVKFFLAAFELAWNPFVFSLVRRSDAPRILARLASYVSAAMTGIGLGVAVLAREILTLMTDEAYHSAHPVIPVIVLAYLIQGLFTLTSIGIGIAKKASYYPLLTFSAAFVNISMNLALIPTFGKMGAAWATVGGYAIMAGIGYFIANHLYPIPYEWRRIGSIALAGVLCFGLSQWAPAPSPAAWAVKTGALALFPVMLYGLGFFREKELEWLKSRISRASD